MNLADRLHCPRCKGRLSGATAGSADGPPPGSLICGSCEAVVPMMDGIRDFMGARPIPDTDPLGLTGDPYISDEAAAALLERLRLAAAEYWPDNLGDVLELGCGGGRLTRSLSQGLHRTVKSLVAADSSLDLLRGCRDHLPPTDDPDIALVRLGLHDNAIRDAVADTVIAIGVLQRVGDPRAFLALVHRALRAGGQAFLEVPNRAYRHALCQAVAVALTHMHAREGGWTGECEQVLHLIAMLRLQLLHQGDRGFLAGLRDKHVFTAEAVADMAREVGFAVAHTAPLEPDSAGGATILQMCRDAGLPDGFANDIAALVVSAGAPFFNLLSRQDASPTMLFCLTKSVGPSARTFAFRPRPAAVAFSNPESALGGVPPRWSIELTARDTPAGVTVLLDGWCLINTDVLWVRLRLNDVARDAPVWRPREDVHGVMNQRGLYHPLNALCSGVLETVLFDGVHPDDNACAIRIEVVLASGLVVQGATPRMLPMGETITIVQ